MTLPQIVPAGPLAVRFVMLEDAAAGAALVVDHMFAGPALRRWRDTDPQGMYAAGQDLIVGQVVAVAAANPFMIEAAR